MCSVGAENDLYPPANVRLPTFSCMYIITIEDILHYCRNYPLKVSLCMVWYEVNF